MKKEDPGHEPMIKEALLQHMSGRKYRPQNAKELIRCLPYDSPGLRGALHELVEAGEIICGKKNCYFLPQSQGWKRGKIQGQPQGYGFFIPEGEGEDLFISPEDLNGAWHGDIVWVKVQKPRVNQHWREKSRRPSEGKSTRGRVMMIISRTNGLILGQYQKQGRNGLVYPLERRINCPIFIQPGQSKKAGNGDTVLVEINTWPEENRLARGRIREVVAEKGQKEADTLIVIKKFGLERDFPLHVLTAADKTAARGLGDISRREDWREAFILTIDGADARDLDDALSLSQTEEGHWLLGVHIADVAHYVPLNSALDREARARGTSVYFPDLVLPMLPPALSNGICSLNPREDRLAFSCIMEIDKRGRIVQHRLAETVIRVKHRLSYEEVNAALEDKDPKAKKNLAPCLPMLKSLASLCRARIRWRKGKGSLDFPFPERKVIMEEGRVVEVQKRFSRLGETIIEEAMIAANQSVAEISAGLELPSLYRVHQASQGDKLLELNESLKLFGYYLPQRGGKPRAGDMQALLKKVAGRPEERLVATLLLRSMEHAYYSVEPLGHFALALSHYSHFTSPIRRYPDLAVHRQLKAKLMQHKASGAEEKLPEIASHSSSRERLAEEAEREVTAILCCRYLEDKLGQSFEGHISGVTNYGAYVELENGIEGLVRLADIQDDYYVYHEKEFCLKGRRGKVYRLGDEVRVSVERVDCDRALIDLRFLPEEENQ